jgi:hypothetical protein
MTAELRTFVDIDATAERVWEVLSLGVPPLNALLRMSLRLTVLEVIPPRRLRFRLRMARAALPGLFDADHIVTITSHDGGGVRLWEDARFQGLMVPLLTRRLNRDNLAAFYATNAALKDRTEGTRPTAPQ